MLFSQSIGKLGRPQENKFNIRVSMQAPQKPIGLHRGRFTLRAWENKDPGR